MPNPRLIEMARRQMNPEPPKERTRLKPQPAPQPVRVTDPNLNLVDYVILEGQTHGSHTYPDLLAAKQKSLHGNDWYNTQKELHQQNSQMLTIRQYVDFINLLKSGKVYDGKGNKINQTELDQLLDEILTVRDPWRAEWLDADFKVINEKLHINYNHRTINGQLTPQISEPLENCLMKDKTPGIGLDDWLNKANHQGLPSKNISKGNLYYWYPRSDNNSVARFWAYSGWVYLNCGRVPSYSDSALGVRAARTK